MSRTLPQTNRIGDPGISAEYDRCQTPYYAISPLVRSVGEDKFKNLHVWEPMCGEGNLVKSFEHHGAIVTGTDLLTGTNYFHSPYYADCAISNPPFSIKYDVLKQAYQYGMPFAWLMPLTTLGAVEAQDLFSKYGIQIILMSPRINFKMPSHKTWREATYPTLLFDETGSPIWMKNKDGSYKLDKKGNRVQKKTTGAQFPTAWFTWKMGLKKELNFEKIARKLAAWEA